MRAGSTQRGLHTALLSCIGITAAVCAPSAAEVASAPFRACWSPDSRNVALILRETGDRDSVHVCKHDGSDAEIVLKDERLQAVSWSPSGARIAVASAPRQTEALVQIIPLDGRAPDTVKLGRTAENVSVGWSPDSSRVVIQLDESILLLRIDDKTIDTLDDVNPPVRRVFLDPSSPLSPDNKILMAAGPANPLASAFGCRTASTDRAAEQENLYALLVKVEGERYTLPVVQYGSLAGPLVWAPDGRSIAFMTRTAPAVGTRTGATGATWLNVVSDVGTVRIDPKRVINPLSMVPVWSPAGTNICYFWRDPTGKCFLNIVNVAFTTVLPLDERLNRLLFAAWNEEASMFVVAVTTDEETICATVELVSGELCHLATLRAPFDRLLPSPNLKKLLLVTEPWGRSAFAVYDVAADEVVRLPE